jgi:hypothetical protein
LKQIKNYRIAQKHDLPSNWEKAKNFIPLAGEIIVYLPEHGSDTKIKIGNGILNPNTNKIEGTNINDLPFFGEAPSKSIVWGDFTNNIDPISNLAWGTF